MPNPDNKGTVRATLVTPAELGRKPRFAWVRIDEGDHAGTNQRVSYDDIEYACA